MAKQSREYDARQKARERGAANPAEARVDDAIRAQVEAEYGAPYLFREDRAGTMNLAKVAELPLAALFAAAAPGVLFEVDESRFYRYGPESGLWRPRSEHEELVEAARFMVEESRRPGLEGLAGKLSQAIEQRILNYLRGLPGVARRGVFAFRPEQRNRVIHLRNGAFVIADNRLKGFRSEFRADDYSRNQIPVAYDPKATCPRFLNELLGPSLAEETREDDIALVGMFFGLFLLGVNLPQKMLILDGAAGSGKSTLAKIAGLLVGEENRANLRTEHLGGRFETAAFVGKTLLMAADVKQRFLLEPGAVMLKSLIGGDMLDAESKAGNERIPLRGCFNVLVTANAQLRVKIENDRGAWRRRLAIVTFREHSPPKRIPDFENILFREEASGILNWALAGLDRLLVALDESGEMPLTDSQVARVDGLLAQSEALESFLRERIEKAENCRLTKAEIREAFWDYCRENRWDLPSRNEIGGQLPGMMKRVFGVTESHSVPDSGGREVQGYYHVGWRALVD